MLDVPEASGEARNHLTFTISRVINGKTLKTTQEPPKTLKNTK